MKKLITICLMMAMGFASNAQTKGPTKEQTVAFIRDYFSNQKVGWDLNGVGFFLFEENFKIKLENSLLSITNNRYSSFSDPSIINREINLQNIESIGEIMETSATHNFCKKYLIFYTVNKKEESKIIINDGRDCSRKVDFEKIKKAFEHLRKLCGAPEPISFD